MSRSCRTVTLGVVLVATAAAATGCSTRRVNRAALVPHMTPTLRSGEPMEAPAEVAVGLASVAHLGALDSAEDDDAVEVPGTQAEGDLRVRLGRHAAIGLRYAQGFDATAKQGKPTQPKVDGGDVRGYGFTFHGMIPTGDPRWHVGVGFEALAWSVPYVEYETCIANCGLSPYVYMEEGRATVSQVALGITPTYRTGRLAIFGGATLRNHPTIEQKGVETGLDLEDEVEEGPLNVVLSAGVEGELGGGVRGALVLYAPIPGPPLEYPPSLAATLTIPLGPRDRPAPAAPPPPPPGPPGAM